MCKIFHNVHRRIFSHLITSINDFVEHHCDAAEFEEISANLHPYPKVNHCGNADSQISQCSTKEMPNVGKIIYLAPAAALHHSVPSYYIVLQRVLTWI
jgi:hypothetical protein